MLGQRTSTRHATRTGKVWTVLYSPVPPHIMCCFSSNARLDVPDPSKNAECLFIKRKEADWLCDQTCRSQDVPCAMPEGQVHPFPGTCPTCTPMNWSCVQIKTDYLARTLGLLLNACKLVVPVSSHRPGVAVRSSAARPTRPAKVPFPLIQYVVHVDQQTHVRRETHLLVPSLQSQ